ncbi:sorting nexin-24 isoform X2 [Lampetra planeri]
MEALVRVTSFRQEGADAERAASSSSSSSPYTVFKVEVTMNGRKHFLEKRYSEFHALHKQLKKVIKTPEFPPKHVRNWVPKVLEQRRQGLEYYLQGILYENEELPKVLLEFLSIRHLPSIHKADSYDSLDDLDSEEPRLCHQPVLAYSRDPYVLPAMSEGLPNIVVDGVLQGLSLPPIQQR